MKVVSLSNPVKSDWLADQGFRLDPAPYLSGALEAKKLLERLPNTVTLESVTLPGSSGIFNGPKFSRIYSDDPEHTVPFLGSTDMLEADFSYLPKLSRKVADKFPYLEIQPGMTLISCSGTIGRMAYVRPDMAGIWSSQHVMKVAPDAKKIPSGYLYSFLRSKFGVPMIASSAYGAIIQHIEPHHIAGLPVPRFDAELEGRIHRLVERSARLRQKYQAGLVGATKDFFDSNGLPELNDVRWHQQERDLGFEIPVVGSTSLRALNFTPRAQRLIGKLGSVPGKPLGEICDGGSLRTGARFKRIDADPSHGVRLIGQRQAFWVRPEGRWISEAQAPADIRPENETIMIAAHGTLGENEVYSRSILVTGAWLKHAFSQDFVRLRSGDPEIPGAYLFAFFRSEAAFRILRSLSVGGKQQEYHSRLLRELPIPRADDRVRARISATVRYAYQCRDRADVLEDKALALLTTAIEEAAG
ncbi:restriction endonuclease subunit S [Streptomyces griseoluteus]|uniref:methylation-associated defense system restriction endonuclease subunit S MAD5 n=1 Tax=Streptomyces griseoluteus TaxID=29306 RepID=UPI00380B41EF